MNEDSHVSLYRRSTTTVELDGLQQQSFSYRYRDPTSVLLGMRLEGETVNITILRTAQSLGSLSCSADLTTTVNGDVLMGIPSLLTPLWNSIH